MNLQSCSNSSFCLRMKRIVGDRMGKSTKSELSTQAPTLKAALGKINITSQEALDFDQALLLQHHTMSTLVASASCNPQYFFIPLGRRRLVDCADRRKRSREP